MKRYFVEFEHGGATHRFEIFSYLDLVRCSGLLYAGIVARLTVEESAP